MTEKEELGLFRLIGDTKAEWLGVNNAKFVTTESTGVCYLCGKPIPSNTRALTAEHLVDTEYGVTLRGLMKFDCVDKDNFNFIPEKHELCDCCQMEVLQKAMSYVGAPRNEVSKAVR
jgi:hypothetical protein